MNYLVNQNNIVRQSIDSLLALSNGTLARVDGHGNTVIRSDYQTMDESALITLGGGGHEPAHASFVGSGMSTAAPSGDVFASPSIDAILTPILLVTEDQRSALVIVKNYSGDKINAGVAVEKAKAKGRDVDILLVADDVSIEEPEKRRGIAGVVFMIKLAGYLLQQGYSPKEAKQKCEQAASGLMSLSITLCGADSLTDESTAKYEPQVGRGIHNEAGKTFTFRTEDLAKEAVEEVVSRLGATIDNNCQYAILINNLGGLTHLEMGIITQELLNSTLKDRIQLVVGPAPFVTSLNSKGFSVSLLALNDEIKTALLSPVAPQAWVTPVAPAVPKLIDVSLIDLHPNYIPSRNDKHLFILNAVCQVLVLSADMLNLIDSDSDCGSTLKKVATHINDKVNSLPLENEAHLLQAIGHLVSSVGGGTMGALLSLLFTRTGIALETGLNFAAALKEGTETMMSYAGSKVGDRTILDALLPAIEALEATGNLQLAAEAARTGADKTATMIAMKGRFMNVDPDVYKGFNDPGAEAVALAFEELAIVENRQSGRAN